MTLVSVEKQPKQYGNKSIKEKYEIYTTARQEALKTQNNTATSTTGFMIKDETSLERDELVERIREIDATKIEILTFHQFCYLMGEESEDAGC